MILPLKLCEENLIIWKICYRIGSTVAVKSGELGVINADTFMSIFSADTWFLSSLTDSYIPRRWNNAFFSGNLSTGTDLVKCITKININSYPIYNGNVEGGLSPER